MTAPGQVERVLVVDDNAQNRAVAEGQLVSAGYEVETAEHGEAGLEMFSRREPDLVLLDILMPGIDGIETCRRMRQLPGGQDTPIVFVTAHGDLETQRQALESGGDDFLSKPIQRIELLLRVRSLLRIKRIARELARNNNELVRVQRQKDDLGGLIVHDLKNPLSAILTNGTFLLETLGNDAARPVVRDIMSAAETMRRMVMNLIDVNRSEDGVLAVRVDQIDPAHLVNDVVSAMDARARERDHELRVSLGDGLRPLEGDYDLLRRVLETLLDNSFKYTPRRGEVVLSCEARDGSQILFRVRDQGPGVPEPSRQRIFEKYVQLESEARLHGRASRGLGLAFCKVAIEAHGGSIWMDEAEGGGSCFNVSLPQILPPTSRRLSLP
ncbi:MAG TPA: response regulator [Polyangiaceae bacterium]|nr:response regulator [Polyangiaceae bacterium]